MDCKCTLAQRTVGDGCDVCNPTQALEYAREEIESLRQQLVSVANERDEIKAQAMMLDRMVDERDDQLTAALAACEAKDVVFEKIGEIASPYRDGVKFNYITDLSQVALAIKPDASALRQHDEALIERIAVVCEEYQGSAETCAAAIRELKSEN